MSKVLIVVDMQNDFIDGALGTKEAEAIVGRVVEKIIGYEGIVIFTRDTHSEAYLSTQEGRNLPVVHCIEVRIRVDASCCAGVTPESHNNALDAMKMCQIDIRGL